MQDESVTTDTREASFLYAVVAAGALEAIADACSQGRISTCTCSNTHHRPVLQDRPPPGGSRPSSPGFEEKMEAWSWAGCTDDVTFAYVKSKHVYLQLLVFRPRRSLWSSNIPSAGLCVYRSICPVNCGKTADRIWMRFGTVGRMGPGMRQVFGFGDRSTGGGNFLGECGRPIVKNGEFAALLCKSA